MFHALPQDTADVVTLKSPCIFPAPSSRKWMEVGRCVPSNRFRQFFWCSNSTVGHGGIQLRDGNSPWDGGIGQICWRIWWTWAWPMDPWQAWGGLRVLIALIFFNTLSCCGMFWDVFVFLFVDVVCSGAGFCHEAFSAKPTRLWAKSTRPWWLQRAMLSPFGAPSSFGKASSQWHRCFPRFDPTTSSLTWHHGGSLHVPSNAAGPCASVAREDQNCTMWSWVYHILSSHHDWHHAFKTPQTCQYHLVMGNHHHHHHHQGKVGTAEFPL